MCKDSDGISGGDKNYMARQFRGNIEYQPEKMEDHKYFMCQMSDGDRIDIAEVCKQMLEDPSRGKEVAPNKPRSEKAPSETSISKRVYNVRKPDTSRFEGLKMTATGFDTRKKGYGITSMYNFRFEKALHDKFAYCRYPCSCKGCRTRLQLPTVEQRYNGPRDTCYLWPIMEMKDKNGDPTGEGYNDWKMGSFETRSDCVMNQFEAVKADTLHKIGERYGKSIVAENFGAYCVLDDKDYPFYIVEWKGRPWKAEKDEIIYVNEEPFEVKKGEWLCRGVWLEKLYGRNWYTIEVEKDNEGNVIRDDEGKLIDRECIVRLETVLDDNVNMRLRTEENMLPSRVSGAVVQKAHDRGAWRISDEDYAFIIEESRFREMNNQYDEEAAAEVRASEEARRRWQEAPRESNNGGSDEEEDEYDQMMGQFAPQINLPP